MGTHRWYNLSKYCYNSSLVVTPRKGSAIIWYSHFRDEEVFVFRNLYQQRMIFLTKNAREETARPDRLVGQKDIALK